jgi:hypothetical protein
MDLDTLQAPVVPPVVDPAETRLLHEELARLPDVYRAPVLLHYFEGLTRAEMASRLGWPDGTVATRLARAKARLAARLVRRGVAPALLVAVAEVAPPSFAGAVARAAVAYSAGTSAGLPATVIALVNQESRRTDMGKLLKVIGVALSLGLVAVGFGAARGGNPSAPVQPVPAQPPQPVAPAPAPPKAVVGKTFAVAPVTTDLQRRLIAGRDEPAFAAFVSIDARGLFPADDLAPDGLDMAGIRAALTNLRPAPGRAVHLQTYHPGTARPHQAGMELVGYALEGVGRRAGFDRATTARVFANHWNWEDHIAPLRDPAGAADREPGVGGDKARAYPVKTPLSRVLTRAVDGVVDVRVRIDGRVGEIVPVRVDAAVGAALRELALPRGSKVIFLLDVPHEDRDEGTQDRLDALCRGWAEDRGLMSAGPHY